MKKIIIVAIMFVISLIMIGVVFPTTHTNYEEINRPVVVDEDSDAPFLSITMSTSADLQILYNNNGQQEEIEYYLNYESTNPQVFGNQYRADNLVANGEYTITATTSPGYYIRSFYSNCMDENSSSGGFLINGSTITLNQGMLLVRLITEEFEFEKIENNAIISITRNGIEINPGVDIIYSTDIFTITTTANANYTFESITVNGQDFTNGETFCFRTQHTYSNGSTYHVLGDKLIIVATATPNKFDLTCEIENIDWVGFVWRTGFDDDVNLGQIEPGDDSITFGEVYSIYARLEYGHFINSFTVNGLEIDFESSVSTFGGKDYNVATYRFRVDGDTNIVINASLRNYDITTNTNNCSIEIHAWNAPDGIIAGEDCYNSSQKLYYLLFNVDTGYELNSIVINEITYSNLITSFDSNYIRYYYFDDNFAFADLTIEANATLRSYSCSVSSYNPFGGIYINNTLSITHNGVEILTNTGEKVITYGEEYTINAIPAGGYIAGTIMLSSGFGIDGVLIESGSTIVANQNWQFTVYLVDLGEQDFDFVLDVDENCALSLAYLDENNQMMGIWPGVDVLTGGVEYFIVFTGMPGCRPDTLIVNNENIEITTLPFIMSVIATEDLYVSATSVVAENQDLIIQSENCQFEISTNLDDMDNPIAKTIINPGENVLTFGHEYHMEITPNSGYVIVSVTLNGEILTQYDPILNSGYWFKCWGETNIVITTSSA